MFFEGSRRTWPHEYYIYIEIHNISVRCTQPSFIKSPIFPVQRQQNQHLRNIKTQRTSLSEGHCQGHWPVHSGALVAKVMVIMWNGKGHFKVMDEHGPQPVAVQDWHDSMCLFQCQWKSWIKHLTHWPLGDLDAILKLQFSILFYWLVSSHCPMIMPWDECHGTSLMISQHWLR